MFGPGAFIFGVFIPLVVVALVIYGVWELARSRERNVAETAAVGGYAVSGTARSILDERFARGDVDAEEYVRRRALLDGTVPSPPQTAAQYESAQYAPVQYDLAAQGTPAGQQDPSSDGAVVVPTDSAVGAGPSAASPIDPSSAPETQEQPAADV